MFFFLFGGGLLSDLGACLDKGLDSDLDQGLTILYLIGTEIFQFGPLGAEKFAFGVLKPREI